jgi:hypothetical protein
MEQPIIICEFKVWDRQFVNNLKEIHIQTNRSVNGALPMIQHFCNGAEDSLTRIMYSLGEIDESRKEYILNRHSFQFSLLYKQC